MAKRVIDATGDADIAHFAGAPTTRNSREEAMGVTTVFSASGVDKKKFLKHKRKHGNVQRLEQDMATDND